MEKITKTITEPLPAKVLIEPAIRPPNKENKNSYIVSKIKRSYIHLYATPSCLFFSDSLVFP
jgi:hypothetical protein